MGADWDCQQGRSVAGWSLMYIHTFQYQGTGAFPVDMLRYDECHPHDSASVGILTHHSTTTQGIRTATLAKVTRTKDPQLTHTRWQSFGWQFVQGSHRATKVQR